MDLGDFTLFVVGDDLVAMSTYGLLLLKGILFVGKIRPEGPQSPRTRFLLTLLEEKKPKST